MPEKRIVRPSVERNIRIETNPSNRRHRPSAKVIHGIGRELITPPEWFETVNEFDGLRTFSGAPSEHITKFILFSALFGVQHGARPTTEVRRVRDAASSTRPGLRQALPFSPLTVLARGNVVVLDLGNDIKETLTADTKALLKHTKGLESVRPYRDRSDNRSAGPTKFMPLVACESNDVATILSYQLDALPMPELLSATDVHRKVIGG